MFDLTNRTVLITGAARGIGRGMARAFARDGARVALADLELERARAVRDELVATGTEAVAVELDVRDRDAFARAVDEVEEQLGAVQVLCSNAGIGTTAHLTELGFEHWDRTLEVNLGGVVNGIQTVLPRMLRRGGPGHLVNTASGAGLIASTNLTYTASKFAVVGLTESLRMQPDLVAADVGASVLCPGLVSTDVLRNSADHLPTSGQETLRQGTHLLTEYGLDPDVVGRQVVAAVRERRLHVQTDRSIAPLLEERAQLLMDSLPPTTARDEQLAPMLRERAPTLTPAFAR